MVGMVGSVPKMVVDADLAAAVGDSNTLEDLTLQNCNGEISLLLSKVPNIKKLDLSSMDFKDVTTVGKSLNVEELVISSSRGDSSALLTAASASVSKLALSYFDLKTSVQKPFLNLKDVSIDGKAIDITGSPLLERGGKIIEIGKNICEHIRQKCHKH